MSAWQVPRSVLVRLPLPLKRAVLFREAHGRWPGRPPRTFTEKVNWRVVHDRRPEIGRLGDKLAMRAVRGAGVPVPPPAGGGLVGDRRGGVRGR